jgi:D-sedoheptulose 7-phosphate isomerase
MKQLPFPASPEALLMSIDTQISAYFARHAQVAASTALQLAPQISRCAELLATALADGRKILIAGNGGSAADAQHFAAELVGRFLLERRGLPAIALTTDSSILTAVANDYGFERIFSRQVEALANAGDVVIGISTSGNSANVLAALAAARQCGCATVGLLGCNGGAIAARVDLSLIVGCAETPHIQEMHVTIIHLLCKLIEEQLFASPEMTP